MRNLINNQKRIEVDLIYLVAKEKLIESDMERFKFLVIFVFILATVLRTGKLSLFWFCRKNVIK